MKTPNSPARMSLEQLEAQNKRDKRKMLLMGLAAVLLLGAYLFSTFNQKQRREQDQQEQTSGLPDEEQRARVDEVEIAFPNFTDEDRAVLEGVQDGTREERTQMHVPSMRMLLYYATVLTPGHYREAADMDAAALADLSGDPGAHRMDLYVARGTVRSLRKHRLPDSPIDEFRGSLQQQDGSYVHFVVSKDPGLDDLEVGSFVVLRGVFLQLYDVELDGDWRTGPLLLGRDLAPSVPAVDLDQEVPLAAIYDVQDDENYEKYEVSDEAIWELMALAAQGQENWDEAPEIDSPLLNLIYQNPEVYRGKPFRFPISRNLDGWVETVGENPLRLERRTVGWMGNQTWHGKVALVKWIGPFVEPGLADRYGDAYYITGRGYFLRNFNYEDRDGQLRRCPLFVMAAVDPFVPQPDTSPMRLMWFMLVGTLLLVGLIYLLLVRDRKQSQALQQELLRRRRERRQRAGTADVASSGASNP